MCLAHGVQLDYGVIPLGNNHLPSFSFTRKKGTRDAQEVAFLLAHR